VINAARAAAAAAGVPYEPPEPVQAFRSSSAELKAAIAKEKAVSAVLQHYNLLLVLCYLYCVVALV
jgi:hypothetical protein